MEVGDQVRARPAPVVWPAVWLLLGLASLAGGAAVASPHLYVLAALPLTLAAAVWLARREPFLATFTDAGLEVEEPRLIHLSYADITAVQAPDPRRRKWFSVVLHHPGGRLRIPARLQVSSAAVLRFLLERLPRPDGQVPAALRSFHDGQADVFGTDKVWAFAAAPTLPRGDRRLAVGVWAAVAVTGVVWAAAGLALGKGYEAWAVFGFLTAFFGALLSALLPFSAGSAAVKGWRGAGLVVTPTGLALVQGDLKGQLRWDEVKRVEYPLRRGLFVGEGRQPSTGIGLGVAGARIVVADYYDRPLSVIHERIMEYWQGP